MKNHFFSRYSLSCIIIAIIANTAVFPQNAEANKYGTSFVQRSAYKQYLVNDVIKSSLSLPLSNKSADSWKGAWWASELTGFRDSIVLTSIRTALNESRNYSDEFIRAALEAAYTLYRTELTNEVTRVLKRTTVRKHFAMASLYLLRAGGGKEHVRISLINKLKARFSDFEQHPVLLQLHSELIDRPLKLPPVRDLLLNEKWKNELVIFSFHRKNRSYEGLTVIKDTSGRLIKDSNDRPLTIPHLARSLSNLPGYITNGNAPEGLFSFSGISSSQNQFIGKTPFIETALPFEVPVDIFFRNQTFAGRKWTPELIQDLLPVSWKDYPKIMESFYAGEAGRSEIVMHGTTIDPSFYKNMPFYPNTPSLGCITAREIYDEENGALKNSDQTRLIQAVLSAGVTRGYLVVLNIDDKNSPVKLEDILRLIK